MTSKIPYWVGMAVAQDCTQSVVCQQGKLPTPTSATMTNVPIGGPGQMLAADILEVPITHYCNRHLLDNQMSRGHSLRDQTATSLSVAVIEICCSFGVPDIVHSDQVNNFESHLFRQVLSAFGIQENCTTEN